MSDLISAFSQQVRPGILSQISGGALQLQAEGKERARLTEYARLKNEYAQTGNVKLLPQIQQIAPEKFEGDKAAWAALDEQSQRNQVKTDSEILSFLDVGDYSSAMSSLSTAANAQDADGNFAAGKAIRGLASKIESGDAKSVTQFLTSRLSSIPLGQRVLESRFSISEEGRSEETHIADLLKRGTELVYGSTERKNWANYLANQTSNPKLGMAIVELGNIQNGATGGMSNTERFNATFKVKEAYNDAVNPYKTIVYNTRILHDLGQADTGFADTAMISLYNKVLDPDSVVRESEVRNTVASVGKWEELKNLYARLKDGKLLPEGGREKLLEASRLISTQAEKKVADIKEEYRPIMEEFYIDEDSAFGRDAGQAMDYSVFEARAMLVEKFPEREELINNSSPEDLDKMFTSTLKAEGYDILDIPEDYIGGSGGYGGYGRPPGPGNPNNETSSPPQGTDPVVTDPVVTDPVVTDPVVTDPVVTDPVVTEPTIPIISQKTWLEGAKEMSIKNNSSADWMTEEEKTKIRGLSAEDFNKRFNTSSYEKEAGAMPEFGFAGVRNAILGRAKRQTQAIPPSMFKKLEAATTLEELRALQQESFDEFYLSVTGKPYTKAEKKKEATATATETSWVDNATED